MSSVNQNLHDRVEILNDYIEKTNIHRSQLWKLMKLQEIHKNSHEMLIDLDIEHTQIKQAIEKLDIETEKKLDEIRKRQLQ